MEDSSDQHVSLVSIVDNVALDHDRLNGFAELGPIATHAGLFDEKLESIEDGVDEPIGRLGARILGDVGPDLLKVLLDQSGQPIGHLRFLGASRTTA